MAICLKCSARLQAALSGALGRSPARNLQQQQRQQQTATRRGKTTLECCTVRQPRMIDTHVPPPLYSTCRCALQNAFHSLLEGCQLCCFVAAVHGQARVAIVSQKCQFKRSCKVCFNSLRASRMSTDSRQGRGRQRQGRGEQVQRAAK